MSKKIIVTFFIVNTILLIEKPNIKLIVINQKHSQLAMINSPNKYTKKTKLGILGFYLIFGLFSFRVIKLLLLSVFHIFL